MSSGTRLPLPSLYFDTIVSKFHIKILVGKPKEMKLLRKPSCNWEESVQMNLKETRYENVNWIHLVMRSVNLRAHKRRGIS